MKQLMIYTNEKFKHKEPECKFGNLEFVKTEPNFGEHYDLVYNTGKVRLFAGKIQLHEGELSVTVPDGSREGVYSKIYEKPMNHESFDSEIDKQREFWIIFRVVCGYWYRDLGDFTASIHLSESSDRFAYESIIKAKNGEYFSISREEQWNDPDIKLFDTHQRYFDKVVNVVGYNRSEFK